MYKIRPLRWTNVNEQDNDIVCAAANMTGFYCVKKDDDEYIPVDGDLNLLPVDTVSEAKEKLETHYESTMKKCLVSVS